MAFFLQLGQQKVGENGIGQRRIKKTGNRIGGESGNKGGYGSGFVQERRSRHKKLEKLLLREQTSELRRS
jgi:hypothetical protein